MFIFQVDILITRNAFINSFTCRQQWVLREKFKTVNPFSSNFFNFLIYNAIQISKRFKKINTCFGLYQNRH